MILRGVMFVAVVACRRVGVTLCGELSMRARVVVVDLFRVANTAVDTAFDRFARTLMTRAHVGVTLGAAGSGVRRGGVMGGIDEQRDSLPFPVHCQVFLCVTCETVRIGHPGVVEDSSYLVWFMAIDAGRDHMGLLFPQFSVDHLAMNLLDLPVTLLARLSDVVLRDAGARVSVGKDEMGRVAGGADGSDGQALLEKPYTMNRVDVVLEDPFLRNVALH